LTLILILKILILILKILILILISINCSNPTNIDEDRDSERFAFSVSNVSQGLAQFAVQNNRAVLFDVGPPSQYPSWHNTYASLGSPTIELIVISHSDDDHYGTLRHFAADIDWSGSLAVSPYEDTAKIRANSGAWKDRIIFKSISKGDTLKILNSAEAICHWPPKDIAPAPALPLDGAERNHYSLVFTLRHGHNRALITSDIDSSAMEEIAASAGGGLRAQILVAPHHGSAGSVNRLFFSYVAAEKAVISCAMQNSYGHPSAQMIDQLTMLGANLFYTYIDNTVTFTSNGYYW
jgi:competence protein ComEC